MNTDALYLEPELLSLEKRKAWLEKFFSDTPHQMLVAVEGNDILGFCCSQPYRSETAYKKTIEMSIYLLPKSTSADVGSLFWSLAAFDLHRSITEIALKNDLFVSLNKKFNFKNRVYLMIIW